MKYTYVCIVQVTPETFDDQSSSEFQKQVMQQNLQVLNISAGKVMLNTPL
jgi:hypothetical protein